MPTSFQSVVDEKKSPSNKILSAESLSKIYERKMNINDKSNIIFSSQPFAMPYLGFDVLH
jgi:hypothetical protein